MSVEELKHQFSIPEAYKKAEIERRVLRPAMESINSVDECDFTFVYEPRYVDGKHAGYRFEISEKNYIDVKAVEVIEQKETDPMIDQLKTFFSVAIKSLHFLCFLSFCNVLFFNFFLFHKYESHSNNDKEIQPRVPVSF